MVLFSLSRHGADPLAQSQEVELLPFFMDLLKNHFPGMVGASAFSSSSIR